MIYAFYVLMAAVIGGHVFFAYGQWFGWEGLLTRLSDVLLIPTDLIGGADQAAKDANILAAQADRVEKTAFLGRSFASYNASVAIGLLLSFRLPQPSRAWVQGTVLILIVATAAVGATGTHGPVILLARLLPAALALVVLILLQRRMAS